MLPIPADVPTALRAQFAHNANLITRGTEHIFIFAADHKIERLESIAPETLFTIAHNAPIGAFATHPGLIARYGTAFANVPYLAKLNGKTNLIPTEKQDPMSAQLWDVRDVSDMCQDSGITLCGVGYTVYLGSEYESHMLVEAAQIIRDAHEHGLLATLWIYPRGHAVTQEDSPEVIAGAASVGASLGADIIKVKAPRDAQGFHDPSLLHAVVAAAGTTRVVISGGPAQESFPQFLTLLEQQLKVGHVAGCAVGRNIFEHPLDTAIAYAQAIAHVVYEDMSADAAVAQLQVHSSSESD